MALPFLKALSLSIEFGARERNRRRRTLDSPSQLPAALLESAVDLALHVALCHVLALVVELLAAPEAQQQFHAAILVEVELKRDERNTAHAQLAVEVVDLLAMQQQLATAIGVAIENRAVGIRVNVHVVQPAFAVANEGEGVGDLTCTLTQAADLGAGEFKTALKRLVDEVLMMRGAILGDQFLLPARLAGESIGHGYSPSLKSTEPEDAEPAGAAGAASVLTYYRHP